jgi:hypothetical protein
VASSTFDASTRGSISAAYVTVRKPGLLGRVDLVARAGAFQSRYGIAGTADEGRYGTPVFARINGIGENVALGARLGDIELEVQQSVQGLGDTAPLGVAPGDWNAYADPAVGTSLAHHYHAGLRYAGQVAVGFHFLHALAHDERANQGYTPDADLYLTGADLRLTLGRAGHLYLGYAHAEAVHVRSLGRVVEVLNTPGGPGLMAGYLGEASGGNGALDTFGWQYDLSVARALYGDRYRGGSPDIRLSLFGLATRVENDDSAADGVDKLKFGAEAGYALLSWLATSVRLDQVAEDMADDDRSFTLISARLILRSDWQAQDQLTVQYSHWMNGKEVFVRTGSPPRLDPRTSPDAHALSLAATFWW